MSPTPHTSLRWKLVMGSLVACVFATIYWWFPDSPSHGLALLGVLFVASNIALPSAAWIRFTDFCRWVPWALGRRGMKPPRAAVILALAGGIYLSVVMPVFARSIPAGLAVLGALCAAAGLAIWRPGRDTIRQWRDERLEERRLSRQLTEMDAHDSEDFSGKGIPRKDWAAFNDELAGVLREMRASEGQEQ